MPDLISFTPERVLTAAAMPGAGYRVEFYESGTTTPVTVYTTVAGNTPHPSPLICDAAGVFPAVFANGSVKAVLTKPDGASFYTVDPCFRSPASASGATSITFDPTPQLPFENVQAAIEGAAASAAAGFTPFGLGVTGVNALIATLDATNTASGAYRFDNTTTGTFPTGVAASDTGTVQIWRENAGDAMMWLQSGAADRQFTRRMASSAWGAWREDVTVNQGATEGDTAYRGASAWTRLAKGTARQVLRMNAAATAPEWATNHAPVLLASKTASASATLDFIEMNNALYSRYRLVPKGLKPATDGVSLQLRFSTDGGATYDAGASAYRWSSIGRTDNGTNENSESGADTAINISGTSGNAILGNAAGEDGVNGEIVIFNAPSATLKTCITVQLMTWNTAGRTLTVVGAGAQATAADTDALRLLMSTGNIASGTVELWGEA